MNLVLSVWSSYVECSSKRSYPDIQCVSFSSHKQIHPVFASLPSSSSSLPFLAYCCVSWCNLHQHLRNQSVFYHPCMYESWVCVHSPNKTLIYSTNRSETLQGGVKVIPVISVWVHVCRGLHLLKFLNINICIIWFLSVDKLQNNVWRVGTKRWSCLCPLCDSSLSSGCAW